MKTIRFFLSVALMLALIATAEVNAQGRGRGKGNIGEHPGRGHQKDNPGRGHDKHDRGRDDIDRWDDDHRHDSRDRRDYDRHTHRDVHHHHDRYVTYSHHRHGPPSWAPAYGYRYNTRYIYYRDYNVYYDCHRDVFITWTGRRWVVSLSVPVVMCHVDFRRTPVVGVDYWDDDFDFYLERRRPSYISISASF